MDDYLSKPIQVSDLVSALEKCRQARTSTQRTRTEIPEPHISEKPVIVAQPEVLDTRALEQLRLTLGRQADRMLPALIEQFYRDADRLLSQAHQALAQGRVEDLRIASHSLKSTSATFGAMALSAVARELESLALRGKLERGTELLAQAEAEFARAKTALEAMRHEP